jgi:allophanate hydrolase subunit 2
LAGANLAVGNPSDAAALEIAGRLAATLEGAPRWISIDGAPATEIPAGDRFEVVAERRRVAYLAVAGGLDVPVILGGRGTLLVAALGGFQGRALRAGDRLPLLAPTGRPPARASVPPLDLAAPIRLTAGPDLDRFSSFALAALSIGPFRVSPTGDRTGIRLDGPAIEVRSRGARSAPMVHGGIQVTQDGQPIVLGPDHPTTGGYPLLAVIIGIDRGAFFARSPNAPVRFRAVAPVDARRAWAGRGTNRW